LHITTTILNRSPHLLDKSASYYTAQMDLQILAQNSQVDDHNEQAT